MCIILYDTRTYHIRIIVVYTVQLVYCCTYTDRTRARFSPRARTGVTRAAGSRECPRCTGVVPSSGRRRTRGHRHHPSIGTALDVGTPARTGLECRATCAPTVHHRYRVRIRYPHVYVSSYTATVKGRAVHRGPLRAGVGAGRSKSKRKKTVVRKIDHPHPVVHDRCPPPIHCIPSFPTLTGVTYIPSTECGWGLYAAHAHAQ